ncbi:MAG: RNA polymerase sigma-70 factor [Bacteroidota bacterium]|nr:RNA polymerase sigma-70 factor [Bacteroidota bacterium]
MEPPFNLEKTITRLTNSEEDALDELYKHFYPKLYYFSKSFLKFETDVEDVLQEVFVKIWINRENINDSLTFSSYIFTITKNALLNHLRSKLKEQSFRTELATQVISSEFTWQESTDYNEIQQQVNSLINSLPEKRQQIFRLSREEGLSNKEISKRLGISVKTVEDHMTHALRYLKIHLKEAGIVSLLYFYLFL